MKKIEDGLASLADVCDGAFKAQGLTIDNNWDRRFIVDVSYHVLCGSALSTAQGEIAVKLIKRYREHLIAYGFGHNEIDELRNEPHCYRIPPKTTPATPREVRYLGNDVLAFRCRYNAVVTTELKKLRTACPFDKEHWPRFADAHKIWLVKVSHTNLEKVQEIISKHCFAFDDNVVQYIMQAVNAKGQKSEAVLDGDRIRVTCRDDSLMTLLLERALEQTHHV